MVGSTGKSTMYAVGLVCAAVKLLLVSCVPSGLNTITLSVAALTEVVKPDSVSPRCSPAVPLKVFCTTCPAIVLV